MEDIYNFLKKYDGRVLVSELKFFFSEIPEEEILEGIHQWFLLQETERELIREYLRSKRRSSSIL
ncbi:hypothetical protein KW850_30495 [Bacillus sp. sid0103]|uniref:hypothetical protein n=1 Tax=Bacillus sp. sid0103 TaxID=2856337 RepID=UPI001C491A8C|nr:hypothetical protein [Bacillus sp. sid0103]MBV7509491.1 hypothetical protein [Bacillus sp. sid0103]